MFYAIRNAIILIFTAISTLANAANKGATALDTLADITVDESEFYRDSRRAQRTKELEQL